MGEPAVCPWCAGGSRHSDWGPYCSAGCEHNAVLAQARAEGEAAGFRRGVAACVADVEGCLHFAAKAAKGPHNSERLRVHRHVRAVVLGQVSSALRLIGGMEPRPEVA